MKILVTGGAGYIGSHTVAQLCTDGYEVVILDNLSTSCEQSVVNLRKITGKEIPLYKVDIRDIENVRKVLSDEKIDAIIHFAAYSLVGESMVEMPKFRQKIEFLYEKYNDFAKHNYKYTEEETIYLNTLTMNEAYCYVGVKTPKIFISSVQMYNYLMSNGEKNIHHNYNGFVELLSKI